MTPLSAKLTDTLELESDPETSKPTAGSTDEAVESETLEEVADREVKVPGSRIVVLPS